MEHIPVLLNEVIENLNPKPNENFIDCTFGFGGHSRAILEKTAPNGRVLGIEWDQEKLGTQNEKLKIESRLKVVNDSYANLKEIIERENFYPINGILLDLGISSWEIENSQRGFSFRKDQPLDMRFSEKNSLTAKEIINKWSEQSLAEIFSQYGQERFASSIAKKIVEIRVKNPIETTFALVDAVIKGFPKTYKFGKTHCSARVFQALRIAVNSELENLKTVLPVCLEIMQNNGRLVVISFHSLEDGTVKRFFKENEKNNRLKIITKKPTCPTGQEKRDNPRASSAKLRAIIKTAV